MKEGYNKIAINYNQWFTNMDYRKELSSLLNLSSYDKGREKVAQ